MRCVCVAHMCHSRAVCSPQHIPRLPPSRHWDSRKSEGPVTVILDGVVEGRVVEICVNVADEALVEELDVYHRFLKRRQHRRSALFELHVH